MRALLRIAGLTFLFLVVTVSAQDNSQQLLILTKTLPPASLWNLYSQDHSSGPALQVSGGIAPYHWRVSHGMLPRGLRLEDSGQIMGTPDEVGEFTFTALVTDNNRPPLEAQHTLVLSVEPPISAEWDRQAQVNGQRIDGSVKVSNRTGRDFDLTYIVLAVNDIGRATAIGYQHFPLKRNTRDLSLPFGDTLSPGNYTLHVDVVAEEPISNRIFRARLTSKKSIAQGP